MLAALTDTDEDDSGSVEAIGVRGIGRVEMAHRGGVLVRAREPSDGAVCSLDVLLPGGVGLAATPRVGLGARGLEVELDLNQGSGGRETFALDRCVPTSTPIRVSFGG
jgi:hypothetical protein